MAQQIARTVGETNPVQLKPYDGQWSAYFDQYRSLILSVLSDRAAAVEHIGSTAVPGLLGRACVDVLLAVAEPDAEEDYRAELEGAGFRLWQREPDRRVFGSEPAAAGAPPCPARLFVCRSGGTWEFDQLLLTHYLGAHEERRRAYADLKRRLAREHRDDPDGYALAKRPFLRETVRMAHRSLIPLD
ncbi:GrpB family protein [Actinospica durhamensis]|uniref:GrpB family protein n=1 Tax=Actinospica durhamensis TaxID=1508375 RepID=A0A941EQ47_9ACTN|nr:GrpB family protein [Actinospica durhamensis]MBR7835877.1 GrpB family protein [Actinospica durhamensis]